MKICQKVKSLIFATICINTSLAEPINQSFQQLDNSIGIGYNFNSMNAYNPVSSKSDVTTNSSNFVVHLEKLFDNNIWMSIDGSFAFKAAQYGNGGNGFSYNTQNFGFPASINGKGGYSFNWPNIGLQVIPYAQIGRELNYNGKDVFENGFDKSYYNQFAFGGRVEYVFTPQTSIYFDQSVGYLQDTNSGIYNQSADNYVSLLGIKYNVTNSFQIALQGMLSQLNLTNPSYISYNPISYQYANTNQTTYGGTLLFSYLYDQDKVFNQTNGASSAKSHQYLTTNFDNSYSVGLGLVNSTASYDVGNSPNINTALNYLNFNIAHEFENSFWAQINGQLVNSITQTNIPSGYISSITPTYIGFPGSVVTNDGYAFHAGDHFTVIPYGNLGIIMNIANYNIRDNSGLVSAISNDMFIQYGAGARAEYAINDFWQIYADQLFAGMKDRSPVKVNTYRSTSSVGTVINPYSLLQFGVKGFYDTISPTGNTYNEQSNLYVPANQNSVGLQFDVGLRY